MDPTTTSRPARPARRPKDAMRCPATGAPANRSTSVIGGVSFCRVTRGSYPTVAGMARFPLGLLLALVVVLGGLVVSCDSSDPSGAGRRCVAAPRTSPRSGSVARRSADSGDGYARRGWSLTVQGSTAANVFDAAVSKLVKDGYTGSNRTGDSGTLLVILSKSTIAGPAGSPSPARRALWWSELGVLPGQRHLT